MYKQRLYIARKCAHTFVHTAVFNFGVFIMAKYNIPNCLSNVSITAAFCYAFYAFRLTLQIGFPTSYWC